MPRDYSKEYAKESESVDQLKIKITKELHQQFIDKLDGVPKTQWILNKIQEFVGSNAKE